jgi:virulence-associated protein VagC
MSYSKHLASYPEELGQLLEVGSLGGVTLPMASAQEAKRLQGRLYAYKGALKKEVEENLDCGETIRNLHRLSQKCQIRVEGSQLIIRPMDQDPDAALIRAVLSEPKAMPAESTEPAQPWQKLPEGQVLVPINTKHLPPWLAELAVKRAEDFKG